MNTKRLPVSNSPLAFYQAGGDGPRTVVLGHALGADHRMWRKVLPLLPRDVRVILWDQPGHGGSALLLPGDGLSAHSIAAALHDGLVELGVIDEGMQPVVAGLSLGGTVSLAYAEDYPADLCDLLMFSSGAALLPPETWTERAQLVSRKGLEPLADATMGRWFSDGFAAGEGTEAVEATRKTFLATSPEGYAQCCLAIAGTDLRPELAGVRVPVQLVVGEDDPGMTPDQALILAEALPDATVTVIEGARHLTAVETPELVADAIKRALARRGHPAY